MFSMFLPDLMHDFELGGWRALFIHLLRILDSIDPNLLTEVDRRYVRHSRQSPIDYLFEAGTERSHHLERMQYASSQTVHPG
jgi:hypothetical protein